jgi:membrane-associated phospholipid phosphatase
VTRLVFRLRPEEAVALVFVLPTTWLTIAAFVYAREAGVLGSRYPGGVARLAVVVLLLGALALTLRLFPRSTAVRGLREAVPLFACFLIYTNLHDTIGFVNPHDVHDSLVALDGRIFGVQPCIWAERFITPLRTEVMQFLYLNFFWIAPSTSLILLAERRFSEFRAATFGIVACFFMGYALYVAFPAAPPRLVLAHQFTKNLRGYPVGFSKLSAEAFSLLPVDSRAAFPSLHAAASLVALVYAWRFLRLRLGRWRVPWWFSVLMPFVLGLWISTIYLRHHYFVDLVAGWLLAPVAMWAAPRADGWWARQQRARGYEPARGAGG